MIPVLLRLNNGTIEPWGGGITKTRSRQKRTDSATLIQRYSVTVLQSHIINVYLDPRFKNITEKFSWRLSDLDIKCKYCLNNGLKLKMLTWLLAGHFCNYPYLWTLMITQEVPYRQRAVALSLCTTHCKCYPKNSKVCTPGTQIFLFLLICFEHYKVPVPAGLSQCFSDFRNINIYENIL